MSDEKDGTTVWDQDGAAGDETEIVPPVTQAAPTVKAWADVQEDEARSSWRETLGRTAGHGDGTPSGDHHTNISGSTTTPLR